MTGYAIRLSDVTLAYDRRPAVHHLSGVFSPGSLTAVVGPNGAGKSTLLKALMKEGCHIDGLIDRGTLRTEDFGYLPQASTIERQFPLTVADVVLLGAWRRIGPFRGVTRAIAEEAAGALAAVGLDGYERRQVGSLSGGQMQRVLFARLLLQDAKVVLLDEPFTAIDAATTRDLLDIVRRWHGDGRTVIAVLHDFDLVRSYFPETLLISRRPLAWGKTADVMTQENLLRARGLGLTESCDENAGVRGEARA
ncbi:metal ABC transporter ATP-binding protein [Bordetella genomosp. 11]|uniref:ABC transporter n=1 Tax=Bordetella genomosp. 11 TaxID=1416808 RepID=A0A261URZ5_9BORD|nr:ABC transporter ATP-binding protein [Bordetella genomosp. 11]OZI64425.1 ABC transporter [Bordetella genomosp. 11]